MLLHVYVCVCVISGPHRRRRHKMINDHLMHRMRQTYIDPIDPIDSTLNRIQSQTSPPSSPSPSPTHHPPPTSTHTPPSHQRHHRKSIETQSRLVACIMTVLIFIVPCCLSERLGVKPHGVR